MAHYNLRTRDRNWSYAEEDEDHEAGDSEFLEQRPQKRNVAATAASATAASATARNPRQKISEEGSGVPSPSGTAGQRRGRPQRRRARKAGVEVATNSRRSILSWLIELGFIARNEVVQHVLAVRGNTSKGKVMPVKGNATRNGIYCHCCLKTISVEEFAVHASGHNSYRPYDDIILSGTQSSIFHRQTVAWRSEEESRRRIANQFVPLPGAADINDDACVVCGDGGSTMICCEKCPSTYHPACIGMDDLPGGAYFCPYCVCKYCGQTSQATSILKICQQCEKKYHLHCFFDQDNSFCSLSCEEVHGKIERQIGVRSNIRDGFSWTLVKRMEPAADGIRSEDHAYTIMQCNSKVAVAWRALNDCFEQNIDRYTSIDILQSVVYQQESNLPRLNFKGFCIAILENNEELVSAATIRIHGAELAEMPYIATHQNHRQKGLSRMLFGEIVSFLHSLNVEHLIIPSVPDVENMWMIKHGFSHVNDEVKRKIAQFNNLTFPGTVKLQKFLGNASFSGSAANVPFSSIAPIVAEKIYGSSGKLPLPDLNLEPPECDEEDKIRPVEW